MSPELIFYSGITICGMAVFCAIIAAIELHFLKKRLKEQFDNEYGKRRH